MITRSLLLGALLALSLLGIWSSTPAPVEEKPATTSQPTAPGDLLPPDVAEPAPSKSPFLETRNGVTTLRFFSVATLPPHSVPSVYKKRYVYIAQIIFIIGCFAFAYGCVLAAHLILGHPIPDRLRKANIVLWTVMPPLYFFIESFYLFPKFGDLRYAASMKSGQDIARAFWAGIVALFVALEWTKARGKRQVFDAQIEFRPTDLATIRDNLGDGGATDQETKAIRARVALRQAGEPQMTRTPEGGRK